MKDIPSIEMQGYSFTDLQKSAGYYEGMTFAARLQEILDDRGLNKSDVARHLGLRPQSVGQWDSGVKPTMPRGKRLRTLAAYLEVTVPQLMAPPGSYFPRKKSDGAPETPANADPSLGDLIESVPKVVVGDAWEQLPEREKATLIQVINTFRLARGLPPIAI